MITKFGKALRKYRIDKDVVLGEMAKELGVSSAYLSAVENGKKRITDKLIKSIKEYFSLDKKSYRELKNLAELSQASVKIDLTNSSNDERELVGAFARKIADLSENDRMDIKDILNR